jgi:hypothetical protein
MVSENGEYGQEERVSSPSTLRSTPLVVIDQVLHFLAGFVVACARNRKLHLVNLPSFVAHPFCLVLLRYEPWL